MPVESITKSLAVLLKSGSTPPPLEQGVACHSLTNEEKQNYEQVVQILTVLLTHLFHQTLSPDVMYLATRWTIADCVKAGMSEDTVTKTLQVLLAHWKKQRDANPISGMF